MIRTVIYRTLFDGNHCGWVRKDPVQLLLFLYLFSSLKSVDALILQERYSIKSSYQTPIRPFVSEYILSKPKVGSLIFFTKKLTHKTSVVDKTTSSEDRRKSKRDYVT